MKKLLKVLISVLLLFSLFGCKQENNDDIVIIYTSDVHGYANENLGYASVLTLKQEALKSTPYVTLIDAGDTIQGSSYCQVSEGEAIVECRNAVGYDFLALGNHEFEFGLERFGEIITESNGQYLNSNIVYTGSTGAGSYLNELPAYEIVEYGDMKVGYIAVDTPSTLTDTNPLLIKEDGEFCIDVYFNDEPSNFYNNIQKLIDEMKQKGADKIICISHLGYTGDEAYSSYDLAANTSDIDVIVDGHAHVKVPSAYLNNKDGKQVIVTCCGTAIETIGYITISSNGTINTTNISEYYLTTDENKKIIDDIVDKYSEQLNAEMFSTNCALSIKDESGVRLVRNRETAIGDLFADAYRYYGEADIALMNGGGIRAGIPNGSVSYSDLIEIAPFENYFTIIEVTGQELVDYFEYCYSKVESEYAKNGEAYGENGSFMQVSGIKLTIDTSIESDITVDENDAFICVNNNRRVKDVYVLQDGEYVPIELYKTYTLAGMDYNLINGGSGSAVIFADNNVILKSSTLYSQLLIDYITDVLNGDLSAYATPDTRITIE